jgi:uncharacterized membrane protein
MNDILWATIIIVFPALVITLYRKIKYMKWLSPVMVCYATGILLANQKLVPVETSITILLYQISIPLAIILILLTLNISRWFKTARTGLVSYGLCIVAASISSVIAAFIFSGFLPNSWKLAGMTVGVYTGGTPNMSAIGIALEVESEAFFLLNAADVVLGAFYLMILLTVAHPFVKLILPPFKAPEQKYDQVQQVGTRIKSLKTKMVYVFGNLVLAGAIFGVAILISHIIFNELNSVLIIFLITTFSIATSFLKKIRTLPLTYETSEYLLLIFCFAIGTTVNFELLLQSSSTVFMFCTTVMAGAILIHLLLSIIFRIDADTFLITSAAGIYGPVFVPAVAEAMKNKEVVITGITAGIIGFAIANYLGILLAYGLKMFF